MACSLTWRNSKFFISLRPNLKLRWAMRKIHTVFLIFTLWNINYDYILSRIPWQYHSPDFNKTVVNNGGCKSKLKFNMLTLFVLHWAEIKFKISRSIVPLFYLIQTYSLTKYHLVPLWNTLFVHNGKRWYFVTFLVSSSKVYLADLVMLTL